MNTYRRLPLSFPKGKGVWLYDKKGNKYLDFLSGVAVNCLGHMHPTILKAIEKAAKSPLHLSNFFQIKPQIDLANKLTGMVGDYKAFFCNSGAEANEASLKLARKATGRKKFISFSGAFHGRTFGTLSVTPKPLIQEGFKPLLANTEVLEFNNENDLNKIDKETAAVIFEFIQGEGGVAIAKKTWIKKLFAKCKEVGALTIADEVQTGVGRTGTFFAWEQYGVKPDIISLAKGLGGGVPIGCSMAKSEIAASFTPGSHASTFGGNPLVCTVALAVVNKIRNSSFLRRINENSNYIANKLEKLKKEFPKKISDIRVRGYLIGIELYSKADADSVYKKLLERKIIANVTSEKVIRLIPPLIAQKKHFDIVCKELKNSIIQI